MSRLIIRLKQDRAISYLGVSHVYLVIGEGIEFEGKETKYHDMKIWKYSFDSLMWWEGDSEVRVHIHKNSIFPDKGWTT